jgi:hypothetical protein
MARWFSTAHLRVGSKSVFCPLSPCSQCTSLSREVAPSAPCNLRRVVGRPSTEAYPDCLCLQVARADPLEPVRRIVSVRRCSEWFAVRHVCRESAGLGIRNSGCPQRCPVSRASPQAFGSPCQQRSETHTRSAFRQHEVDLPVVGVVAEEMGGMEVREHPPVQKALVAVAQTGFHRRSGQR